MGNSAGKASVSLGVFFQNATASDRMPMVSLERKFAGTIGTLYANNTKRTACPKAAMTPQSYNTCGRGLLMMPKPMPAIEANKPSRNISDRVKDIDNYKILTGDNRLVCGTGVQIVSA